MIHYMIMTFIQAYNLKKEHQKGDLSKLQLDKLLVQKDNEHQYQRHITCNK